MVSHFYAIERAQGRFPCGASACGKDWWNRNKLSMRCTSPAVLGIICLHHLISFCVAAACSQDAAVLLRPAVIAPENARDIGGRRLHAYPPRRRLRHSARDVPTGLCGELGLCQTAVPVSLNSDRHWQKESCLNGRLALWLLAFCARAGVDVRRSSRSHLTSACPQFRTRSSSWRAWMRRWP